MDTHTHTPQSLTGLHAVCVVSSWYWPTTHCLQSVALGLKVGAALGASWSNHPTGHTRQPFEIVPYG